MQMHLNCSNLRLIAVAECCKRNIYQSHFQSNARKVDMFDKLSRVQIIMHIQLTDHVTKTETQADRN